MNNDKKHVVWSNIDLDLDDWRQDMIDVLLDDGVDEDTIDDDTLREMMINTNSSYLDAERLNLNIKKSQPIIAIADIGRWNGRFQGYKMIKSGNIKDCLYSDTDYSEWYVDKLGDLRADCIHHDDTNHYLYRVFKDGVTSVQIENLQNRIYNGTVTRADITRVTARLGDDIKKVHGWN